MACVCVCVCALIMYNLTVYDLFTVNPIRQLSQSRPAFLLSQLMTHQQPPTPVGIVGKA
jgi:hypothetical protein